MPYQVYIGSMSPPIFGFLQKLLKNLKICRDYSIFFHFESEKVGAMLYRKIGPSLKTIKVLDEFPVKTQIFTPPSLHNYRCFKNLKGLKKVNFLKLGYPSLYKHCPQEE